MAATSTQEIQSQLRAYFAKQLPGWTDQISNSELLERYGLDSTEMALLIFHLEESFGIQIDESDLTFDNLGSINGLSQFIERKSANG